MAIKTSPKCKYAKLLRSTKSVRKLRSRKDLSAEGKVGKRSKIQMGKHTLNMITSTELRKSFLGLREGRESTVNWRDSKSKPAVEHTPHMQILAAWSLR